MKIETKFNIGDNLYWVLNSGGGWRIYQEKIHIDRIIITFHDEKQWVNPIIEYSGGIREHHNRLFYNESEAIKRCKELNGSD